VAHAICAHAITHPGKRNRGSSRRRSWGVRGICYVRVLTVCVCVTAAAKTTKSLRLTAKLVHPACPVLVRAARRAPAASRKPLATSPERLHAPTLAGGGFELRSHGVPVKKGICPLRSTDLPDQGVDFARCRQRSRVERMRLPRGSRSCGPGNAAPAPGRAQPAFDRAQRCRSVH
jgi:hypothetical protein